MYQESIEDPDTFWGREARNLLGWSKDFSKVRYGNLTQGDVAWFLEGQLNASYNCIDRHAFRNPNKVALIHEANHPGASRAITYGQLLRDVCQLSWVLTKDMGVRKGDVVAIYMPTIAEAVVAMLACARIGAVHTVIFAGFSADSLRDRIADARCRVVITVDESQRADKSIGLKTIVDAALALGDLKFEAAPNVLVYRNTGAEIPWVAGRDMWWHEETQKWPGFYPPERMDSEDPLFLLYTSGSTGKPKGVLHTTGGYLVGAAATGKYVFDIHDEDRFFCGGDVAWITGHTYVVYAPLLLGVTTVTFAGIPIFPTPSRYWDIIDKHNITHLYVAPTALRLLKRLHPEIENRMPYLRVLGSVGEPIAADTWNWYFGSVGKSQSPVVDVGLSGSIMAIYSTACTLQGRSPLTEVPLQDAR